MAARRCSLCGINYPVGQDFVRCPVHTDEATRYFSDLQPDDNWEWAATALLAQMGKLDDPAAVIPVVNTVVPKRIDLPGSSDLHWLDVHDLIRAGFHSGLPVDSVFMIPPTEARPKDHPCDCYWEVVAYSDRDRAFVVRPLRVPDYPPLV